MTQQKTVKFDTLQNFLLRSLDENITITQLRRGLSASSERTATSTELCRATPTAVTRPSSTSGQLNNQRKEMPVAQTTGNDIPGEYYKSLPGATNLTKAFVAGLLSR